MKKYLFVSLLLILAHAQVVKAEATDVSTEDNLVYAMPLTAAQGDKAVDLCFAMKNSAEIRGFQMKIYLPEGVTVAKTTNGKFQYKINDARLPEGHEQQAIFSEHTDANGDYVLMTCNSQYDERFSTGDGEIFSFKVDIAEGMEPGEYPVILREMKLSETDISKYYVTAYVESTLTIEENDGSIVLDENSTEMPTEATSVNVKVKRTINANSWSTICLPFAMTAEQITEAFGDASVADFIGCESTLDEAEENVIGIKVNFQTVTSMEANHPYIIKVSEPISVFKVQGVDIIPEEAPSVDRDEQRVKVGSKWVYFYNSFIGTLVAETTLEANTLFISGNQFWYSKGKNIMKAFRGYFSFIDILQGVDSEDAGSKISFAFDTTGIKGVKVFETVEGAVYTIGGQLVGKDVEKNQLKKGVYIKDGKKFVVD